jgi:hypothetical protein
LSEVERFKATEYRQLLLYTGPVVFHGILSDEIYRHFLLMSVGISLLCNPKYCISCNGYANDLLVLFVQQSQHLYGREFVVYNVHGLIHLAADVANHGSLDAFSAFPYENYLKSVKRLVRKPETPLPQIVRRLSEQRRCKVNRADNQQAMSLSEEHYSGPVPDSHNPCQQFRKLKTDKFFLSQNGAADNCAVVHGLGPVLIRKILKSSDDNVPFLILLANVSVCLVKVSLTPLPSYR